MISILRPALVAILTSLFLAAPGRSQSLDRYALIPWPEVIEPAPGAFLLNDSTRLFISNPGDPELRNIASFWRSLVNTATGYRLEWTGSADSNTVHFVIDSDVGRKSEGYTIEVSEKRIELASSSHAGLFRSVQTLRQLMPPTLERGGLLPDEHFKWEVPSVRISDSPRFAYRGMHLDVARHFFPASFIKRYIDFLVMYKLNTFHWHLTEDQGWRIEIKGYPRLTDVGAYRKETLIGNYSNYPHRFDGERYGGYYTQEEIREIVRYAADRYVTIIPEIEMPGHSLAALASYPELACTEGPFEVATKWGIFDDIYCPTGNTFEFLENVLLEVIELFPGEYIHIGGDEAPKIRWKESAEAQAVIEREGLDDEQELQSYFIQRIGAFLEAHGRKLIGWDEILEGGLPPGATVMSWRGESGGIKAAQQGHAVIMTPNHSLYFDHFQADPVLEPYAIGGMSTLNNVYSYDPVPDTLTAEEADRIIGVQANVWTEYMKTPQKVEYMIFPRMLALAETAWTRPGRKNWFSFQGRMPAHYQRLRIMGVNYRKPETSY